jgi:Ion channel
VSDELPALRLEQQRQRYGAVLAALLLVFLIQGIADPSGAEQVIVSILLGATLLLALWATKVRSSIVRTAAVLVAAAIIASLVQALEGNIDEAAVRLVNLLLVALAPWALVVGVARTLRARRRVTLEAVFGVLSVYLLLGLFFAFTYGSIDRLGSGTFFADAEPATVSHCLYYSFTTLTTVGYGDLTAATNLGHTLSALEALLGQIYLVTIVALIVANLGRASPAR